MSTQINSSHHSALAHSHHHSVLRHRHSHAQIKPVIKYRPGIFVLSAVQIISGLLILTLEAIGSVLSVVNRGSLREIDYAGLYVGLFSIPTGILGIIPIRRTIPPNIRRYLFMISAALTTFLALQAFAMCCALAATLVLTTTSWDSIMEFVNRVSKTVDIPLSLATTTTTMTSSLPPNIQAEIENDRLLLTGVRASLFVLYFVQFCSAVMASCFGCCNFCKCWMRQQSLQLPVEHAYGIATISQSHPTANVDVEQELVKTHRKSRKERLNQKSTTPKSEHHEQEKS